MILTTVFVVKIDPFIVMDYRQVCKYHRPHYYAWEAILF